MWCAALDRDDRRVTYQQIRTSLGIDVARQTTNYLETFTDAEEAVASYGKAVEAISTCEWAKWRGKQACEPPKSRWSPPPIRIHNLKQVTNALPAFRVEIGYLGTTEFADGRVRGGNGYRVGCRRRD
ncbi:hypothetical protein EVAR_57073_1 [Eumeta japonica]|uniref:Uncharacterized protein n=1 Tax=Eumeta variegata TaxID=151549 RepID=A0A4C1Y6H1_EUMVA|nr:hypothetical protein EVAR_57073_1 [Eumeta japonica]